MFRIKISILIIPILMILSSCNKNSIELNRKTRLVIKKAQFLFNGIPYTGETIKKFPQGGIHKITNFKNGKKHGIYKVWYRNGQIQKEINYLNGKKVDLSYGWHRNGSPRVKNEYKDGKRNGEQWSWHDNGKLASFHLIKDDKEVGYKLWRKDGVIYTNYVRAKDIIKGIKGTRGCDEVN